MQEMTGTEIVTERMSPLEDDILAMSFANRDHLDMEPELFRTKWFDYRMMTPVQATRHYIEAYHDTYKRFYATEISRKNAEHVRIFNVETVMEGLARNDQKAKRQFAACWRGRQVADAMGIPYRDYITLVMGFRLRFWKQRHLPQPQHLYGRIDVERAMERWEEMQAGRLYLSNHPVYLVENYNGISHQDDYHEWLFKQAQLRSNPPWQIAEFVKMQYLPFAKVEARLDADNLELVKRYLN